jgi:uncharacterized membrane protein
MAQLASTLGLQRRKTGRSAALWCVMMLFSVAIPICHDLLLGHSIGQTLRTIYSAAASAHRGRHRALLVGPWQFSENLRARALNLHRWLGRFYLLEVGLGSIAGFSMAFVSSEGLATHLGFGILAVLWFFTGLQAYRLVRRGKIGDHREWMIRNFALTFAAVMLRIEPPFMLAVLHWSFRIAFITVSWLCWVPNLLIAEWMVRQRVEALAQNAI